MAGSSVYAKAMGTYIHAGNCWWWRRSPGYNSHYATGVDYNGIAYRCSIVNNPSRGVRPALNLNLIAFQDALSSELWSYAGTVCSDGTVDET